MKKILKQKKLLKKKLRKKVKKDIKNIMDMNNINYHQNY